MTRNDKSDDNGIPSLSVTTLYVCPWAVAGLVDEAARILSSDLLSSVPCTIYYLSESHAGLGAKQNYELMCGIYYIYWIMFED